MFGSAVWSRLVVVGVLAVIATPALAQKGGGKGAGGVKVGANGLSTQQIQQQIQNIVKQIQQGEKPLKEANDRMGEERRTFQKAELDHKTNVRDLNQAKKQAEEEENLKKKTEEENLAKTRADNCERAIKALTTVQSGARISLINAKGEREFMDDAGRATEAKRLQGIAESDCNK